MNEMNKLKRVNKITMINYKIDEKIHSNLYYPAKKNGVLKMSPVPDNVLTMVNKLASDPLTKNPYEAMERYCKIINDDTDMINHRHSMTKIMESLKCGHYAETEDGTKNLEQFIQLQAIRWDDNVTIRDQIREVVNMSQLLFQWVTTRRDCWEHNIAVGVSYFRFDKLLSKLELYNDFVGLADIVADRYIKQYKIDKSYKLATYETAVQKKTVNNESNIFEAGCVDEIKTTEIPKDVKNYINGKNNTSFVGKIVKEKEKWANQLRANLLGIKKYTFPSYHFRDILK